MLLFVAASMHPGQSIRSLRTMRINSSELQTLLSGWRAQRASLQLAGSMPGLFWFTALCRVESVSDEGFTLATSEGELHVSFADRVLMLDMEYGDPEELPRDGSDIGLDEFSALVRVSWPSGLSCTLSVVK